MFSKGPRLTEKGKTGHATHIPYSGRVGAACLIRRLRLQQQLLQSLQLERGGQRCGNSATTATAGRTGRRRKLSVLHGSRSARLPGNASAEYWPVISPLVPLAERDLPPCAQKTAACTAETRCVICHAFRAGTWRGESHHQSGPQVKALCLMTASSRFQAINLV